MIQLCGHFIECLRSNTFCVLVLLTWHKTIYYAHKYCSFDNLAGILFVLSPDKDIVGLSPNKHIVGLSLDEHIVGLNPDNHIVGLSPDKHIVGF